MKITSNTTKIESETWKELVRFLKPPALNLDGWSFQFQQGSGSGTSGRAWEGSRRIHIRVGSDYDRKSLKRRQGGGGYLPCLLYTHEEDTVLVLAHELRHAWQYQHPKGRRVWGSKGSVSERDADAYAIHMLREWRRRGCSTRVAAGYA